MRRNAFLFGSAAVVCRPFLAEAATETVDRLAQVRRSGVLRVGTCGDYKPFTYHDPSGGYEGFDIDVARSLAASLSARAEFVATTWPTLVPDLLADHFDIAMGGISVNEARARVARFSHAYMDDGKVPLVRTADRAKYTTLEAIDRPNVRVAVNPGGTNQTFVNGHLHDAKIIVVEKNLSIPEMIARGEADVMVTDTVEARLAAKNDSRLAALDVETPFTHEEKAYLLHAGDDTMLQAVNAWIDHAKSDGTFAQLRSRWIP